MSSFGGTVKLTGESEYRQALKEITSNLKVLNSEMKVITSQYDANDKSVGNLSRQNEVLNNKFDEQQKKVNVLAEALEKSKQETGENSEKTKSWQVQLNNAQADLNKLTKELGDNADKLEQAKQAQEKFGDSTKTTINSIRDFASEMLKGVAGASNFGQTLKNDLLIRVDDLKDKVKTGANNIKEFGSTIIDNVKHPQKLGDTIKNKLIDVADKLKSSTDKNTDSLDEFGEEAEDSGEKALKLGDIIKANLIGDAIKGGLQALVNGFKELGSAMSDAIANGTAYADNILTLSAQTGLSTETLEKYNAVAELTDVSMETLTGSMAKNIKAMSEAQKGGEKYVEAYSKLGVTVTDANGNLRDSETVYWETVDALKGIENETERDALAMELFGKKAQDLNTIIEMGSEGVKEYTDKAEQMGIVLGQKGLEALGNLDDQMQIFKSTTSGTGNILASAFAPALTDAMGGVNDFAGSINGLISAVLSGDSGGIDNAMLEMRQSITGTVRSIRDAIPQMMETATSLISVFVETITMDLPYVMAQGSKILSSLISGISKNINTVVSAVVSIVAELVETILENLPLIVNMGVQILVSLIRGITNTLPQLIPLMVDTVVLIVETCLDNIDLIIDAGIELLLGLTEGILDATPRLINQIPVIIEKLCSAIFSNLPRILAMGVQLIVELGAGIIKAIPQLLSKIPQVLSAILSGLGDGVSSMASIGADLLRGIWDGMGSLTDWLWSNVSGMLSGLTDKIKSFFGIASPSKLFKNEIGHNLATGIGEGFTDTMKSVTDDMNNAIPTEFDATLNANVNSISGASATSNFDMTVLAFKRALSDVKVFMNDREMGTFVTNTVERVVFA